MSRLSLLALVSVMSFAPPAHAVMPDGLDPAQRALVSQAEQALGRLTTVAADFIQNATAPDGTSQLDRGTIEINRPGKMRIDYAAPSPVLLVADGTMVAYVDRQLKQATFIPLNATPAGILLRANLNFADPDVLLVAVREQAQVAELDVQLASDPGAGTLTMIFAEKPFELRQWRIKDAQGVVTTLTLQNIKTGVAFNPDDFYQPNLPGPRPNAK